MDISELKLKHVLEVKKSTMKNVNNSLMCTFSCQLKRFYSKKCPIDTNVYRLVPAPGQASWEGKPELFLVPGAALAAATGLLGDMWHYIVSPKYDIFLHYKQLISCIQSFSFFAHLQRHKKKLYNVRWWTNPNVEFLKLQWKKSHQYQIKQQW